LLSYAVQVGATMFCVGAVAAAAGALFQLSGSRLCGVWYFWFSLALVFAGTAGMALSQCFRMREAVDLLEFLKWRIRHPSGGGVR
jgi:hypothetical protein